MVLRNAAQRLRDAAQALFLLYEKYPYTANSIVGATMFTAGELSVQYNICGVGRSAATEDDAPPIVDWPKVGAIGVLGAVQNGIFAVTW